MIHGHSQRFYRSKTYNTWAKMKSRCYDKNHASFYLYGEKGITVCPKWHTFKGFLDDMGERPEGLTLDRIDGTLGYSKSNCKWSTPKEQSNHMSRNRLLTCDGITLNHSQWTEKLKLPKNLLYSRKLLGWTDEEAIKTPVDRTRSHTKLKTPSHLL